MDSTADGSNGPLLRIEGVSRVFQMGEVQVAALQDIDFTIESGEVIVILGPSGSGKTTLLNLIGGIDQPTSGHLWHGPLDLAAMDERALTEYRREKLGFIFQFYNLVPTLTAYENVEVAAELVADPMDTFEALATVGLSDRADHFPAQLSGGEQQRTAIARALVKRPELILADEPTGALDLPMARQVLAVLQRLNRDHGLTVILITHNPAIAAIADRSVKLVSGRVAEVRANENPIPAEEVVW